MKPKYFIPTILIFFGFLFLPKLAFGALNFPEAAFWFSIEAIFIVWIPLLVNILIEASVFNLMSKNIFQVQIKFSKILLVVIVAEMIKIVIGYFTSTLTPMFSIGSIFILFMLFFIYSVLIEWAIYIPFFRKTNIGILNLLLISFIVNLFTGILYIGLKLV